MSTGGEQGDTDGTKPTPTRWAVRFCALILNWLTAASRLIADKTVAITDWAGNAADAASIVLLAVGAHELYTATRSVALLLRAFSLILRMFSTLARGHHTRNEVIHLVVGSATLGICLASAAQFSMMPTFSIALKITAIAIHVALAWWSSKN